MTDEQIFKMLECCSSDKNRCDECPIQYECQSNPFISPREKEVLDFVKRQQAEIERLRGYKSLYEELKEENLKTIKLIQHDISAEKVKAIKEFAERLKWKAHSHSCRYLGNTYTIQAIGIQDIDSLVKEMRRKQK